VADCGTAAARILEALAERPLRSFDTGWLDFLRAVHALGATGSELAASKLAQLLDQTSDPDLENAIIEALGEVGHSA